MDPKKKARIREYLLEAKNSITYYTVSNYYIHINTRIAVKPPDLKERRNYYQLIGLEASALCEERDIEVGDEFHTEFHRINTYPEKILAEVIFGSGYSDIFPDYSENIRSRYPFPPRKN